MLDTTDQGLLDLQKQKLQGDLDNQKWNGWLNGAGIGLGLYNTHQNKRAIDSQISKTKFDMNQQKKEVARKKEFRNSLANF